MLGNLIDILNYKFRSSNKEINKHTFLIDTDYGKIRAFDTKGTKPIIINVPDGPNVLEHQLGLIKELSYNFRVICFEYPGVGLSHPNANYNYSIESGTSLLLQIMDILKLEKVSLLFSCSNGFYAINLGQLIPSRINHIFLSQTPSISSLKEWTKKSIPDILEVPIVGQITNAVMTKKLVKTWYRLALPKNNKEYSFEETALGSLNNGGCFCLSSLVQGMKKDLNKSFWVDKVPTTLVWGPRDFTHRKTNKDSIQEHIKNCEVIEFPTCGHFPELENKNRMVKLITERIK